MQQTAPSTGSTECLPERVGGAGPGQARPPSASFARHVSLATRRVTRQFHVPIRAPLLTPQELQPFFGGIRLGISVGDAFSVV